MLNELVFLIHTFLVFGTTLLAFVAGRHAIQVLVCLYIIMANFFVVKKMLLFGFVASGSDMYIIGSMCALIMAGAAWGEDFAYKTATLSVFVSLFFFVLCWFQIAYLPLPVDTMHPAFVLLLERMPQTTIASIGAHYVSQMATLLLSVGFTIFVNSFKWSFYTAQGLSMLALLIGQVIDGILFFYGAFGFSLPVSVLVQMLGVSVVIKFVLVLMSTILIEFAQWARKKRYV